MAELGRALAIVELVRFYGPKKAAEIVKLIDKGETERAYGLLFGSPPEHESRPS